MATRVLVVVLIALVAAGVNLLATRADGAPAPGAAPAPALVQTAAPGR